MNNKFNKKFASNELSSIRMVLILATLIYAITTLLFIGYNYSVHIPYLNSIGLQGFESQDYTPLIVLMIIYYASMVLMPIYQFRYLYNKKSIDFFHSLPIKRTTLMLTKVITGYVTISALFALFFIITSVAINYSFLQSINFLLLTFLTGALIYACILFIINITNNIFFLITTIISLVAIPFFVISGVCSTINTFTILYVHDYDVTNKFSNLFNILMIDNDSKGNYYMYHNNNVMQILIVLIITATLLLISIKLYNMRKSYENSRFIIFKPIRITYVCILTFTISLILSTLFFEQSTAVIYAIIIFCVFLVSVLIDVTTNFNNGNQKQEIKYAIIPAVLLLGLFNVSTNNFYGAFDTIPTDNIKSISIHDDYNTSYLTYFTDPTTFGTIQTVENDLIQQYYEQHTNYNNSRLYSGYYVFTYEMSNGNTIDRKYQFTILDNIDNINAIVSIPDYKQNVINALTSDKANIDINVLPIINDENINDLTTYSRQTDFSNYYNGTTIKVLGSNSNEALLDALILDIKNDKDFQIVGYTHPDLGTIYIDINQIVEQAESDTGLDAIHDATKNYTYNYESLQIPLKPYYTNTLQAINYNPDNSVLLLDDFSQDTLTKLEGNQYFSYAPPTDDGLQVTQSVFDIIQNDYYANNDNSYEEWLFSPLTVDELLDRLRKYDLLTDYTILSSDEELQQYSQSYTLELNSIGLVTNTNATNYRAFLVDNATGEVKVSNEKIITTEPYLY